MQYEIIPMTEDRVSSVAELEKICFPDPWSENSVRGELQNPLSLWLCAVCEGRVIGYVGSQTAAGESDIMNVAVHPDFRRLGVGEALITALCEKLKEQDISALLLEVRLSNLPAEKLYEKLGFQTVGIRPNYYFHPREDARIMRKELMET